VNTEKRTNDLWS